MQDNQAYREAPAELREAVLRVLKQKMMMFIFAR
jgi:hypothetical protein